MNSVNDDNIEIEVKEGGAPKGKVLDKPAVQKPKKSSNGKQKFGIVTLIVGILVLIAGAAYLLIDIFKPPVVRDADFLVEVGAWQMQDEPTVIWDFKEIGKGSLTTNAHTNDYDFIWAIEGDSLKIETSWLYTLNNDYTYKLDQNNKVLTITDESGDINFVPASSVDAEVTEDN